MGRSGQAALREAMGQNPNRLAPSEHPNPTTKIGSIMGGTIDFDPQQGVNTCWLSAGNELE